MEHPSPNDEFSDDEVFFGKLTLKEVKKHILWNDYKHNPKKNNNDKEDIRIIETHSEPDLIRKDHNRLIKKAISNSSLSPDVEPYSNWDINPANDSFLKVEKLVTDLCVLDESEKDCQLNNTLDIVDYVLNNGPQSSQRNYELNEIGNKETASIKEEHSSSVKTNLKSNAECTSVTGKKKAMDSCVTPTVMKQRELFKTPVNPQSQKKPLPASLKKTPNRSNAYQYIASPVASYIRNCPVTPLVKEVRPTKPLPGMSAIPKFVKISNKSSSKEKLNLPPVAYKSAKMTKVIEVPDESKLLQNQWLKNITSSLPKPVILKHNHREINLARRNVQSTQEDSFVDFSFRQADVSICTKKSAFNKPKTQL